MQFQNPKATTTDIYLNIDVILFEKAGKYSPLEAGPVRLDNEELCAVDSGVGHPVAGQPWLVVEAPVAVEGPVVDHLSLRLACCHPDRHQ